MKKASELHLIYIVLAIAIFSLATVSSRSLWRHSVAPPEAVAVDSGLEVVPSDEQEYVPSEGGEHIAQAAESVPVVKKEAPKPLPPAHPEYPGRISIPSIKVDAAVQAVGLTKLGSIASPGSFSSVGWFIKSALPGETGSMLVDGHVDNGLLRLGVFKHLDRTSEGDDIYVTTRGGEKVHYTVTRIESFPYKEVPMESILNQTDGATLVLITCAGDWIGEEKTYDKRLVVTAALVE